MDKKDVSQFQKIVENLISLEKNTPVAKIFAPSQLADNFDLSLNDAPSLDNDFYSALDKLVEHAPKTASNRFYNQLIGGRRSRAVLGDLVACLLNNSMYTYKVAGPMVGIEQTIISKIAELIGFPKSAVGAITNGGSMSNFTALVMARDKFLENCIQNGVHRKMILYTSEVSHYSIAKNASLAGIGKNQVRKIDADERGRMNPSKLTKAIEKDLEAGNLPFFINITSGTTVLGAFDPIEKIITLNKKYNLWVHIDGAYGGATLFSKKYNHLINGVEHADSFSISAHKMLGTPLTCSVFITNHKQQLFESFSSDADYLYQTQSDDFNPGKSSFQCGRRNDALKLWTLWKSLGTSGMEQIVDHQFELANFARNYIIENNNYKLFSFEDSSSICFTFKGIDAEKLSQALHDNSIVMVSHGSFKNQTFIRLVTINSDNNIQDIKNFFTLLETFVNKNPTLF